MNKLQENLNKILQEKETKILPENLRAGITALGVTGTLQGGDIAVKLFETQEEMQADSTAKEGDLALVYRSEVQNMKVDSEIQVISFPETVVLPEAFTGDAHVRLRPVDESSGWMDINLMLSQNSMNVDVMGETFIRVQYESSDGITYTRTRMEGDGEITNPVDLGMAVKCENVEEWTDNFGYFIQIGGNTFEGLFKYGEYQFADYSVCAKITDLIYDSAAGDIPENVKKLVLLPEIHDVPKGIYIYAIHSMEPYIDSRIPNTDDLYKATTYDLYVYEDENPSNIFTVNVLGTTGKIRFYKTSDYKLAKHTIVDNVITNSEYIEFEPAKYGENTDMYYLDVDTSSYIGVNNSKINNPYPIIYLYPQTDWNNASTSNGKYIFYSNTLKGCYIPFTSAKYLHANTQLNLVSKNQLLPGIKAYGNNGVVEGSTDTYKSISMVDYVKSTNINLIDVATFCEVYDNSSIGAVTSNHIGYTRKNKLSYDSCLLEYTVSDKYCDYTYKNWIIDNDNNIYDNNYNFITSLSTVTEKTKILVEDSVTGDLYILGYTRNTSKYPQNYNIYKVNRNNKTLDLLSGKSITNVPVGTFTCHNGVLLMVGADTINYHYLTADKYNINTGEQTNIYNIDIRGTSSHPTRFCENDDYVYYTDAMYGDSGNVITCKLVVLRKKDGAVKYYNLYETYTRNNDTLNRCVAYVPALNVNDNIIYIYNYRCKLTDNALKLFTYDFDNNTVTEAYSIDYSGNAYICKYILELDNTKCRFFGGYTTNIIHNQKQDVTNVQPTRLTGYSANYRHNTTMISPGKFVCTLPNATITDLTRNGHCNMIIDFNYEGSNNAYNWIYGGTQGLYIDITHTYDLDNVGLTLD